MKTTLKVLATCATFLGAMNSTASVSYAGESTSYLTAQSRSYSKYRTCGVKKKQEGEINTFLSLLAAAELAVIELIEHIDESYFKLLESGIKGFDEDRIGEVELFEALFKLIDVSKVGKEIPLIPEKYDKDILFNIEPLIEQRLTAFLKNIAKVKIKSIRFNGLIRQFYQPSKVFDSDMDFAALKEIAKHTNKALGEMKFS